MQRNACDAKLAAPLPKLRGPISGPHAGQIRKQHALGGQVFEHVQGVRAQMHQNGHAGFFTSESDGVARPVHVLTLQTGNVALARAQVPAKLIQGFPLRVHLGGNDALVFFKRDAPLFLKLHFRPLPFRQD